MKPRVYVETSVVGYLTSWPSGDLIVAGHQKATRDWWVLSATHFDLYVSAIVVQEAGTGDAVAAAERLQAIDAITRIAVTKEATDLAESLVTNGAVPKKYWEDALHIALAAVHAMDYLVTWNFKHIANPAMRAKIDEVCEQMGFKSASLCSPEQLYESYRDA